jgi:hypothetical protein
LYEEIGAQRQTRVNVVATLTELHFLSFALLGFVVGISVDLEIVFHNVLFLFGTSLDLEMAFHSPGFVVVVVDISVDLEIVFH